MHRPFDVLYGHRPESNAPVFLLSTIQGYLAKGLVYRLSLCITLAALIVLSAGNLYAERGIYSNVDIIEQDNSHIVFSYSISDTATMIDGASGSSYLSIKGCDNVERFGIGYLPVKTVIIGIPHNSNPQINIISSEYAEINYAGTADMPIPLAELNRPAIIRSQKVASVNIFPLIPSGNSAKLLQNITIEIDFQAADVSSEKSGFSANEGRFDKIFSGLLLNYEQARAFRRMKDTNLSTASRTSIFEQLPSWIRLGYSSTGIHKLTFQDLDDAGIEIAQIDPRTIRFFRAGGKPLPRSVEAPQPELEEMAIHVQGGDDGSFDQGDYIVFYLPAPSFYEYDSASDDIYFVDNHYTAEAVVFMGYGAGMSGDPLRMTEIDVAPQSDDPQNVFSYRDKKRFEQNNFLSDINGVIDDYYNWFWVDDDVFDLFINIDDITGTGLHRLQMSAIGRNPSIKVNGFSPDSMELKQDAYNTNLVIYSDAFKEGLNTLDITIDGNIRQDHVLNYLELEYQRRIQYRGGTLTFYGPKDAGTYYYNVNGITATEDYTLIDASDMFDQKILTGFEKLDAARRIEFEYAHLGGFHRLALSETDILSGPSSVAPVTVADLFNPGGSFDVIVVAPELYLSSFSAYRDLRQNDGYTVYLASVEDIYAQFAGGMTDLVAIRNFLKYAYENWPSPSPAFCLLGGDGTYDFMNYTGAGKANYVPPFVVDSETTVSDENYVLFDDDLYLDSDSSYPADRGPDMVVGRWPVRNSGEVTEFLAKLGAYESGDNSGRWQNRITYLADDENKPGVSYKEPDHTNQAENLANRHTPSRFNKNKIYMIEYPLASNGEKPQVNQRVVEALNEGTLILNFVGHGNPRLWTDERVFRNDDIASLNNEDNLPVIIAASCSIGEFDNPAGEGMAELFFRYTQGGAIGIIATTRLVFSRPNADFNYMLFDVLFSGQGYSLAEAVYTAKFIRQQSFGPNENDRKFIMFGDPLMKLATPDYKIEFVRENIDTLAALNLVTIEGQVVDDQGILLGGFDGSVDISVFDNEQQKIYRIPAGSQFYELDYTMPGARLFRGRTEVNAGQLELQFIVPKDISYGGNNARISAYAVSSGFESGASGAVDSIVISGSVAEITDSIPPEITVELSGNAADDQLLDNPLEGKVLQPGMPLNVFLFDSSGINLSGEVGHRFEVIFNDDPLLTYDLTDEFIYDAGSYQRGRAVFEIPDIENGNYTLKIKAWDSANNSAQKEYNVAVGEAELPQIVELFNVPNPFKNETQFYYELSTAASQVSLDIFTLAGRKIHTIRNLPGTEGENISSIWNGRDSWGDEIANGVYIYKLNVRPISISSDNNRLEKFGKLVILR